MEQIIHVFLQRHVILDLEKKERRYVIHIGLYFYVIMIIAVSFVGCVCIVWFVVAYLFVVQCIGWVVVVSTTVNDLCQVLLFIIKI
jgi:hypothetical protein